MLDGAPMSLRFRLIGLVCLVLLISLALGAAIAYSNASRSVRTEMRAALLVGRQTIENTVERLQTARDPLRDLDDLVASFNGNRHLRVRLSGEAAAFAAPATEKATLGGVPEWFVRIIGVAPQRVQIPVAVGARDYGTIVIETDPYNETREVWNEFTGSLVTPAVFCGLTILLIYIFIGRTLQPLNRLAGALEEIGDGRYRTRISGRLAPELARLRDSFNRMAVRLAETDARDLHDEVSPYLFAIGADAATALRLLKEFRASEARENVQSIADAVRPMQRQVGRMLGRLRPIGLSEFGLKEAIENLVAFWRRRRPEICYEVTISPQCEDLGDLHATTICRVVQEALSNAVRHAGPSHVAISIEHDRDEIRVAVNDDGPGMQEQSKLSYGLVGIKERVSAIGGRLTFSTKLGEGFAVIAALPVVISATATTAEA